MSNAGEERFPSASGERAAPRRTLPVLVVERDPHVRDLESHYLGHAGYSVEFADDGMAALAHARLTKPRIVITEILVPKLDGLALCRQLKADPLTRDIKVLVFTILAAAVRAKEAGADGFLNKPLAQQRLLNVVEELLELQ
jgi:CheY-like chemotaxis protein